MNVETPKQLGMIRALARASMEPRPHERGNGHCAGLFFPRPKSFNGATSS